MLGTTCPKYNRFRQLMWEWHATKIETLFGTPCSQVWPPTKFYLSINEIIGFEENRKEWPLSLTRLTWNAPYSRGPACQENGPGPGRSDGGGREQPVAMETARRCSFRRSIRSGAAAIGRRAGVLTSHSDRAAGGLRPGGPVEMSGLSC